MDKPDLGTADKVQQLYMTNEYEKSLQLLRTQELSSISNFRELHDNVWYFIANTDVNKY